MVLYGCSGVVCLVSVWILVPSWIIVLVCLQAVIMMAQTLSFFLALQSLPLTQLLHHEQGRELGGQMITLFAMLYISLGHRKGPALLEMTVAALSLAALLLAVVSPGILHDSTIDSHCSGTIWASH